MKPEQRNSTVIVLRKAPVPIWFDILKKCMSYVKVPIQSSVQNLEHQHSTINSTIQVLLVAFIVN